MAFSRRKFIGQSLSLGVLLPPMPPGVSTLSPALQSPKGAEHVASLKKVSVQSFAPSVVPVDPADGLRITSIAVNGNQVTLTWTGGIGPFTVECGDLHGNWKKVGTMVNHRTQTIISTGPEAYFRIHDYNITAMSYKLNDPQWTADPTHANGGPGMKLTWTWPPPDFTHAADPLFTELFIQRSTSSVIAVNTNWPLKPDFVGVPGSQHVPTPEAEWETIAVIPVPPQYMFDTAPIQFRSYNDAQISAQPTIAYYYRIVSFMKVDILPDLYREVDWAPNYNKLTAPGAANWVNTYGGTLGDKGEACVVDSSGNIFVVATFVGTITIGNSTYDSAGGSQDMLLIKLNSAGVVQWSHQIGITGLTTSGVESPHSIALDTSGNIIIGGDFSGTCNFGGVNVTSAGFTDCFLVKYNSSGDYQWQRTFGSVQTDNLFGVTCDTSDNIIVCGVFSGTINVGGASLSANYGGIDTFLIKYPPGTAPTAPNATWAKHFGDLGADDQGNGVAIDRNDNSIIVVGNCNSPGMDFGGGRITDAYGGYVANYNSAGVWQWAFIRGKNLSAKPYSVALDSDGDVYVTGYFFKKTDIGAPVIGTTGTIITGTAASGSEVFLVKYSGVNGAGVWARGIVGDSQASSTQVVVDPDKNVIIAGYFQGTFNFGSNRILSSANTIISNGFAAKYDTNGGVKWAQNFGVDAVAQSSNATIQGVGVNPDTDPSNIHAPVVCGGFSRTANLAGTTKVSNGAMDIFIASLNPT